ncbi:MAG TPA: response regulator, partial [Pyrinomonadaceae bacterium]|nr:response regulator [Pyrinomonadaceae bacterium]
MAKTLTVLNIEDSERDSLILRRHLQRAGYEVTLTRVETSEAMREALAAREWDIILSDYSLPHFNALSALEVLREGQRDVPFIIISGTIGEAVAVEAMRAGAHDYLMKDNLVRLAPTIERELKEAESRRARRQAEEALRLQAHLLNTVEQAVIATDSNGTIIYWNRFAEKLYGWPAAE